MYQDDYWRSTGGQFLAGARRFLEAASILTETPEWSSRGKMLQTPVLHLTCHGIELLLKFPLLRAGASQAEL
jgi:hypothetical protein